MQSENLSYALHTPVTEALPLVLDSPHSDFTLPEDFQPAAPMEAIRSGWDAYLDDLWAGAVQHGATLVCAKFPRTYIDANRAVDDIDELLLAEPWPHSSHPTDYSRRGQGLIRRYALPNVPMYDRLLTVAEIEYRLNTYYLPYRAAVSDAIETARKRHGHVWHIDLHSMKSKGNAMNTDAGKARPDFVISDRMGTTSDPKVTGFIADSFRELGYTVLANEPYKGGDIVRTYGKPDRNQHSVQIEINRALYMDERTCEKSSHYPRLKEHINQFLERFVSRISTPSPAF
ncbi:N-formylglutamate amidohydrolase [Paraburkholderia sp. HD33-4]|uniref:N-formylglutamate amidohydrolase n=1 Tax=Paraburkholderia sp. HD33-4 TaxID=2883242 RepID=UPI001F47411B|nr:N-formylglutamate amidohydrolase [Paraburkholderia sp. HD33-4]